MLSSHASHPSILNLVPFVSVKRVVVHSLHCGLAHCVCCVCVRLYVCVLVCLLMFSSPPSIILSSISPSEADVAFLCGDFLLNYIVKQLIIHLKESCPYKRIRISTLFSMMMTKTTMILVVFRV